MDINNRKKNEKSKDISSQRLRFENTRKVETDWNGKTLCYKQKGNQNFSLANWK